MNEYQAKNDYFGCICGRFCNRIHKGQFTLNDITYALDVNEHITLNSLHGGFNGFDKQFWEAKEIEHLVVFFFNLFLFCF